VVGRGGGGGGGRRRGPLAGPHTRRWPRSQHSQVSAGAPGFSQKLIIFDLPAFRDRVISPAPVQLAALALEAEIVAVWPGCVIEFAGYRGTRKRLSGIVFNLPE